MLRFLRENKTVSYLCIIMNGTNKRLEEESISLRRYSAQVRLPEIGEEGQKRLLSKSVLIVGCGALGSVAAAYLAGAGIGRIGLADFDTVDESNLHRQVLYGSDECGQKKVALLANHLERLNPAINVSAYDTFANEAFIRKVINEYDFIIDAADNPQTTYMLDRVCRSTSKGYVTAGVSGWKAQVFTYLPGGVDFGALFPPPEEQEGVLPCSLTGIIGPLAGIAACIEASEAIKYLAGIEGGLGGKVLTIDLLGNQFDLFSVE